MKKIVSTIVLLLFCLFANAQYFTLTEKGFVSNEDQLKDFVVIEKSGKEQKDLFNTVKSFATQFYSSPKDVISESGSEIITLNGVSLNDVYCKKGLGAVSFKTNYTLVFQFKDGKIRINRPIINSMRGESRTLGGDLSGLYQLVLTKDDDIANGYDRIVIFNKGKYKKEAKESIEALFNTIIDKAINYIQKPQEDW